MKHKTSKLTGELLDAAVAKADGRLVTEADDHPSQPGHYRKTRAAWGCHIVRWYARDDDGNETDEEGGWEAITNRGSPSRDWGVGGPIIEREAMELMPVTKGRWVASASGTDFNMTGSTPLIAAMRAYVASKLGDEVELG